MDLAPSLLSRAAAFVADVVSNWWGLVGFVTTLLPVLDYFMPEKVQKRAERVLNLASANRRLAMVILGAVGLLVAAFQAYDGASEKARVAQAELAQAKAELAQVTSGEARRQQSGEAARRQIYVSSRLSSFATRALDLWRADVTREDYTRWAHLCDALVAEAAKWAEDNLGGGAKDKMLARPAFPNLPGARLVDPSQRERLVTLDAISTNALELAREFNLNLMAPSPAAVPSRR